MPFATKNFLLEAFLDGDVYSASADRRRFSTIDNQMYRVSELTGDGVISGWEITDSFPNITVSPGGGIVDKFYVETFDEKNFTLENNSYYYIYAKRKVGVIGKQGPRSEIQSAQYINHNLPDTPTNFTATADPDNEYFSIILTWNSNTDPSLNSYVIERGTDGINYSALTTISSSIQEYTDSVQENTHYYYRISAVNLSNYYSLYGYTSITTGLSPNLPTNPANVIAKSSERAINILWDRPNNIKFSNIKNWKIIYKRLLSDGTINPFYPEKSYILDKNTYNYRISEIDNGQLYSISMHTIDIYDRVSDGILINSSPQPNQAPLDPVDISYDLSRTSSGIKMNLNWLSGENEYDPSQPYFYRIYITVSGLPESAPITVPIGFKTQEVSLFTFPGDLINYNYLPYDKNITFRITSVDKKYAESYGNYIKIYAESPPETPKELLNSKAEFIPTTGKINITWDNQSDTYSVYIQATKISDSETESTTIIDSNIGYTDKYYIDAEIGYTYTIKLIPYNKAGLSGTASVLVTYITEDITDLPLSPTSLLAQAGDKEIKLSWNLTDDKIIKSFRIYRIKGSMSVNFNLWTLVDEVPSTFYNFTDYGLDNNSLYTYYVTSVDIWNQESPHLIDGFINLTFAQATPRAEGIITAPYDLSVINIGSNIQLTWSSLAEEFDAFIVYRSVNNLHSWEQIVSLSSDTTEYLDESLPLIDNTYYYYSVQKIINDADIDVRNTSDVPEKSICLGEIETKTNSMSIELSCKRNIKDFEDPINEYTFQFLLNHKHAEIQNFDPERINLDRNLVVSDWSTVDGKIFTTTRDITGGSEYILKVDSKFPSVLYKVYPEQNKIIFAEKIVDLNTDANVPQLELTVVDVNETQGELNQNKFKNLHARQIAFGQISQEQLPSINHEGRIQEELIPETFLMQKFNNHLYSIPNGNKDTRKNLGNITTFFSIFSNAGLVEEVVNFNSYDNDSIVAFKDPGTSETSVNIINSSVGVSKETSFQDNSSYRIKFEFVDTLQTRWAMISTNNAVNVPNPIINLKKRIRFKVLLQQGSVYLTLGVRQINSTNSSIGSDGGTIGPVEWVGISSLEYDDLENIAPIGKLIEASDSWQDIDIDLSDSTIRAFTDGLGVFVNDYGVLDHIALTINPDNAENKNVDMYISKIEQVVDVLSSGTSQGLLYSTDFGSTWITSRFTQTPVHKFYSAENNSFSWAISGTEALLTRDIVKWFATKGLNGCQFIRDITEDLNGNMYASTDKGVYFFDIELINSFPFWEQTNPIQAFTTECYGLVTINNEILVSTDNGIFYTTDQGETWNATSMMTENLPVYQFEKNNNYIYAITKKHLLIKTPSDTDFEIAYNFYEHESATISKMKIFNDKIFISTNSGVYYNTGSLFDNTLNFVKIFNQLDNNDISTVFCLDKAEIENNKNILFIGSENTLLTYNEDGNIAVKSQQNNKEIPTFYINNEKVNTGYLYSCFNNAVIFREPLLKQDIVSSDYLPRKKFIAKNGGWSHTNSTTDVFIYVNNIPKWIDFKIDKTSISSVVDDYTSKMNSITLTDFNSLYPDSQEFLDSFNAWLISKTIDGVYSIDRDFIKYFIDSYSYFVSVINSDVAISSGLNIPPQILLSGINRSDRDQNSKSQLLEEKNGFTANESVGININAYSGEVDFLTIYNNTTDLIKKNDYNFSKYDKLTITLFNTNILNTGEYSHRELEDQLEQTNTGLSASLADSFYTNLIKAGIFLEKRVPNIFSLVSASKIQAKYYSADFNDWYDFKNSTIDFISTDKTEDGTVSNYSKSICILDTKDIWIGTDNGIMVYTVDESSSTINLTNILSINSYQEIIWDIYRVSDNEIYVISENTETKESDLFITVNQGESWSKITKTNLPANLYRFMIINGNKIISTSDGIYYNDNNFGEWYKPFVNKSIKLETDAPATSFSKSIFNLSSDTFVFAESEKWFYSSGSGVSWLAIAGQLNNNDLRVINVLYRYKNITWAGTDKGLYNDGNSILSDVISFGLITGIEDTAYLSSNLNITSIVGDTDYLYCSSDSSLYRYSRINNEEKWDKYTIEELSNIEKISILQMNTKKYIIATSYNKVYLIDVTETIGVFG